MKIRLDTWKGVPTALILFAGMIVCFFSLRASAQPNSQSGAPASPANQTARPTGAKDTGSLPFREDWSSLSIKNTDLHSIKPLLGNSTDLPQNPFVRELYQVQWRPDDPMDLYVIRPRKIQKPPVVLYLYSFPWDTERFRDATWCTKVTAGGYAAVGFVSALTGHRFHDRPMKEWFVSQLQESLGKSVHDVQMILNYLETREDVDMTRVGMFGTGSGGTIAILAAAADPRIKAIDVLDPWGDWRDWLAKSSLVHDDERAKFLDPAFLAGVSNLDPVRWLPKLTSERIRIQDTADNTEDPLVVQNALEAVAPQNAEINRFGDGAALVRLESGGALFQWMKDELAPGAEQKTLRADQRVHEYPAQGSLLR
jgi:hypothetical protein